MLAKINGVDITGYIQETSYKMNQEDETEDFRDGNYKLHRIPKAKKVNGSFDMAFVKTSDLQNFLDLVENNKRDGLLRITLWVTNINREVETDVYFTMKSTKKIKINSRYDLLRFNCEVEEA